MPPLPVTAVPADQPHGDAGAPPATPPRMPQHTAPQTPLQRAAERLRSLQRFDDQRPSVPGEHWFAFGAGAALLLRGRRSSSALLRTAATVGGLLFMARGLSGRDGLLARLQQGRQGRQPHPGG